MRRRLVTFLVALLCYATAILYVHHGTSRLPRPRSASTPAASAAVNPAAPPATPAALRTTPAPPSGTQHAFALVLGPRTSIDAAVVIAHSLARTSECVQQRRCALLLLLTPGAPPLTHDQQLQLQQRAWHAIQPAAVPPPLRALPPEHAPSLARLALWGLTTYSRVVAVPDDAVVLRSPDALLRFAVPNGTRLATGASAARAAAPGPAAGLGDDVAVVFPEDLTFRALGAGYHALWERDPRQPPQRLLGAALRGVPCVPLPDAVSEATPAPADAWGHLTVLRYSAPRPWEFAGGAAERGAVRAGEAFALWWELYEDHHRGVWEGGGGDGAGAGAVIGSAGNGAVAWGDPHSVRYSGFFAAAAGEGPPGPGTHLWLARSTPHSYLRRLPSAERRARNLTLPGLLLLTSLPGEHCDKYCYKRQDACAPGALSFSNVNDCRALRRVYNCSVCLYDAAAPWAPAFDTATQVCIASHPAVAPAPGALSCNVTSPKGLRRLCPCVPTDSYYEPPVPYVPRDPFTLPSRPLAEAAALGDYAAERARHPSGCYPAITDYTAESDAECTRYLSNWSNVQAVTVMAATGLLGRTVKFRVVYKVRRPPSAPGPSLSPTPAAPLPCTPMPPLVARAYSSSAERRGDPGGQGGGGACPRGARRRPAAGRPCWAHVGARHSRSPGPGHAWHPLRGTDSSAARTRRPSLASRWIFAIALSPTAPFPPPDTLLKKNVVRR